MLWQDELIGKEVVHKVDCNVHLKALEGKKIEYCGDMNHHTQPKIYSSIQLSHN